MSVFWDAKPLIPTLFKSAASGQLHRAAPQTLSYLLLRMVSMLPLRVFIPFTMGALLFSSEILAETYTVSTTPPSPGVIRSDTDGTFTVSVPSSLWTYNNGPITRRYGTLHSRRILPNGSVQSQNYSISPNSSFTLTGRLRGTTEFYQVSHCYEYMNSPSGAQCFASAVYLTVQSYPNQFNITQTLNDPLTPGDDLYGGEE